MQGHTAETTAEILDDVAIHERPADARVDEEQGGTASLIDIMNAVALDLHKATLERIELFIKPLRACYRARVRGASAARARRVFHRHKNTSRLNRSALGLLPTCLRSPTSTRQKYTSQ